MAVVDIEKALKLLEENSKFTKRNASQVSKDVLRCGLDQHQIFFQDNQGTSIGMSVRENGKVNVSFSTWDGELKTMEISPNTPYKANSTNTKFLVRGSADEDSIKKIAFAIQDKVETSLGFKQGVPAAQSIEELYAKKAPQWEEAEQIKNHAINSILDKEEAARIANYFNGLNEQDIKKILIAQSDKEQGSRLFTALLEGGDAVQRFEDDLKQQAQELKPELVSIVNDLKQNPSQALTKLYSQAAMNKTEKAATTATAENGPQEKKSDLDTLLAGSYVPGKTNVPLKGPMS